MHESANQLPIRIRYAIRRMPDPILERSEGRTRLLPLAEHHERRKGTRPQQKRDGRLANRLPLGIPVHRRISPPRLPIGRQIPLNQFGDRRIERFLASDGMSVEVPDRRFRPIKKIVERHLQMVERTGDSRGVDPRVLARSGNEGSKEHIALIGREHDGSASVAPSLEKALPFVQSLANRTERAVLHAVP